MKKVVNKKARFNYNLSEKIEAGLVLTGAEVKSVKHGRIRLDDAFIRIDNQLEAWLTNAHIHPYQFADNKNYDSKRPRKVLLHKKQILSLVKKIENRNMTIVPTSCYTKKNTIKIELSLAQPKKKWQKKELIKRRDIDREVERELKNFN